MAEDTSISIRVDSETKQQLEQILAEIGLTMTSVVNMLFRQIVREKAIPLSLNPNIGVANELLLAKQGRSSGYAGRSADEVAEAMESIISEVGQENHDTPAAATARIPSMSRQLSKAAATASRASSTRAV